MHRLRLATRGSPLALAQAEGVANYLSRCHPDLVCDVVVIETEGDHDQTTPLRVLGGQGVFVKHIQRAVLEGQADVAVHSAKDLPSATPDGLVLAAFPERADPADVLVGATLAGLGPGATVATGSPRRRALLLDLRPDLNVVELRGNMARRLSTPGREGINAVLASAAALERLGATPEIIERLEPESFTPQVGQGALALETRDDETAALIAAITDKEVERCVLAERAFQATLGSGCTIPAGAWATVSGDTITLRGVLAHVDGHVLCRDRQFGSDPVALGQLVANTVLEEFQRRVDPA